MNKKRLGIILIIIVVAYFVHSKMEANKSRLKMSAFISAYGIALDQGWIAIGSDINPQNAPNLKLISDSESDGLHITTGEFTYFPDMGPVQQCKRITFSWSHQKGAAEDQLLKQEDCQP
ncbi:hypothetical protein [Vibrio sp. CK2-1]|uniref:hypothetical protein n=1 Tax=Vibrio sp. CK2-1 TaxID=2912249 RepID=UPI001F35E8FF|nr:hypothetical protein [Vibrio sp. CK2-1]MCF7353248.1 hypothetical protein [Vibrio sp. CK2-1]